MNFFIWRKNVSFSRYLDFCIFVKFINFKVCVVITGICSAPTCNPCPVLNHFGLICNLCPDLKYFCPDLKTLPRFVTFKTCPDLYSCYRPLFARFEIPKATLICSSSCRDLQSLKPAPICNPLIAPFCNPEIFFQLFRFSNFGSGIQTWITWFRDLNLMKLGLRHLWYDI